MQITPRTPEAVLAEVEPHDTRVLMTRLDEHIRRALPSRATRVWEGTFWGGTRQVIVGYGDLAQQRRGGVVQWFVVGLAPQKHGASLYVNAVRDGTYLIHAYGKRLGKVKLGAASIAIRKLDDLDLDVLSDMLREAHRLCPPGPDE